MRVNSISVIQPNNSNGVKKVNSTTQNVKGLLNENINPTFKSKVRWGGAVGTLLGTVFGVGVAIATGGIAAPLIFGAAGAIGGDITDKTLRPESSKEEEEKRDFNANMDPNYRDY